MDSSRNENPLNFGHAYSNWQELWDALFWRFIDKNRQYLQSNPRLGMMVITYDKMNAEKRERLTRIASEHLKNHNQPE